MFVCGTEIDKLVKWPLGTAEKLAKRGKLPFSELPDGAVRFVWAEIEPLIRKVPASCGREVQSCT